MFCGDTTLIGVSHTDCKTVPLKCRRWTCDECFVQRARELRHKAASGEPSTFLTLTVNPAEFTTPTMAANRLSECWRLLRQQARREKRAEKIEFLAVFEVTKQGWPHLHILCRAPWLDQAWISQCMAHWMNSPIVDIRAVYNRRHASRYIGKYVSKSPFRFAGCKRYWTSRGYDLEAKPEEPAYGSNRVWWLSRESWHEIQMLLENCEWVHGDEDDDPYKMYPSDSSRWPFNDLPPPDQIKEQLQ